MMNALDSAMLLEHPFITVKEYGRILMFLMMNTIPTVATLSYGSSFRLYWAPRSTRIVHCPRW